MPEQIQLLSTRPLSETLLQEASAKGIVLDTLSFIETAPILDMEVQQEVEWAGTEEAVVVFTSMNAVDAVTNLLNGQLPEWRIYCIGYATLNLVKEYFGTHAVIGTADNAAALADSIIEEAETDELIFFCGNQRRDELPDKLRQHQITVSEIVVYETNPVHHKLNKQYDAILFFSPSAVESFFATNSLPETTILFVIGETTARTARTYCKNPVIISKEPGKEQLAEQAMAYFSGGE